MQFDRKSNDPALCIQFNFIQSIIHEIVRVYAAPKEVWAIDFRQETYFSIYLRLLVHHARVEVRRLAHYDRGGRGPGWQRGRDPVSPGHPQRNAVRILHPGIRYGHEQVRGRSSAVIS
jgi:hypothetical protein